MIRLPWLSVCLLPWLLAGLAGGCGRRAPAPPPEVLYAGCAEAGVSPQGGWTCWLDSDPQGAEDRSVRLWIDVSAAETPELRLDGEPLPETGVEVRGGLRFEIPFPPTETKPRSEGVSMLELRAADGVWRWRLAVAEREPAPPVLETARAIWNTGETTAACQSLEDAAATAPAADRCRILRRLADLEKSLHVYREDSSRGKAALRDWARAAEACRTAGHLQGEADHRTVRVHYLIEARRFGEAYRELTAHPPPAGAPALVSYLHAFYRGQLATEAGDFRSAGDALRSAIEVAKKVALESQRWQALEQLGLLLQTLGQTNRATEIFRQLVGEVRDREPCDRARLLNNQAWSLLLAREAGQRTVEDPIPLLEEADRIYSPEGECTWPEKRRNGAINLALAQIQDDRPAEARRDLAAARGAEGSETLLMRLWRLELEARLALLERRPTGSFDLYRQLDALATDALWPEGRWRAAYGKARALEALGDRPAALAAFGQAEDLLDQEMLRVAVHESRGLFLAQRERATRDHLELLLARGETREADQALKLARRSRARVLRSLWRGELPAALAPAERQRLYDLVAEQRRARQELDRLVDQKRQSPHDELARLEIRMGAERQVLRRALDAEYEVLEGEHAGVSTALATPAPGELLLVFHPLPQGWVGFAATHEDVLTWRFDLPPRVLDDPHALTARLLMPIREALKQARVTHVLAYGALREVDLHALPFGGSVLLAEMPVVYRLDLPRLSPGGGESGRSALVVADPRLDLPAARDEGEAVTEALRRVPGWGKVTHLARQRARRDAVLTGLIEADLFHYAGHGRFRGWESNLPLADGRLTLGDVLSLEPPPAGVVLSACDSASSSQEAPQESIGLAQAFLLAGSHWVLAASRPVGDEAARSLFGRFYELWDGSGDPATALRETQLAWREANPRTDWASFRLLVP